MTLPKIRHEIRDPVHVFIDIDSDERDVLDSRPVQRLRNIHQLALQFLVYPGATHKRFEHALGVMELSSRVFDRITRNDSILNSMRSLLSELSNENAKQYWRKVLRMAALCHDIGHLPFSHAGERELLPNGWTHESITHSLILSAEMADIWKRSTPPLTAEHVAKLAVGQKELPNEPFTDWEALLSEIVVGDAFGVDRMDYLLRDSLHAGVQYGRFDHHRLVDTLRILPKSQDSSEPTLGLEIGGIHSAEAMLIARYAMWAQLYLHPVRRAYDRHLIDFLGHWLPGGKFPIKPDEFLPYTDVEVLAAMASEARSQGKEPLQSAAKRIIQRLHFKEIYSKSPVDRAITLEPGMAIRNAIASEFGAENVWHDYYVPGGSLTDFPVLQRDDRIVSSIEASDVLGHIPVASIDSVFVEPEMRDHVTRWLTQHRQGILEDSTK